MAAGASFLVAVFGTPLLIRWLRARGIGQHIRDDGPIAHPHAHKAGTPTMGGIAIVGAVVVGYFIAHLRRAGGRLASRGWALLLLLLRLAPLRFLRDYLGVRARRTLGLRKRGKTLGIGLVALLFALLAVNWTHVSTRLSFTRPAHFDFTTIGWIAWAVLVVYAAANALNLTDGLDGLA